MFLYYPRILSRDNSKDSRAFSLSRNRAFDLNRNRTFDLSRNKDFDSRRNRIMDNSSHFPGPVNPTAGVDQDGFATVIFDHDHVRPTENNDEQVANDTLARSERVNEPRAFSWAAFNLRVGIANAQWREVPRTASDSENSEKTQESSPVSSHGCDGSVSSSIVHGYESFDTWQHTVRKFVLGHWPEMDSCDIQLERIKGGSYNRIVGINVLAPLPSYSFVPVRKLRQMLNHSKERRIINQYILRVPLNTEAFSMPYDVTILAYIRPLLRFPTPEVIGSDKTCHNTLQLPYMIQHRLDGMPLNRLWDKLNHQQKKSAVEGFAKVILNLHELTSQRAGVLSPKNSAISLTHLPILEQLAVPTGIFNFQPTAIHTQPMQGRLAKDQTPAEFLISMCERQHNYEKYDWDEGYPYPYGWVWNSFIRIIKHLHAIGVLPDNEPFYFLHGDLFPRNVLMRSNSPTTVEITGVLDWDMAHFGPKFMAMCPPFYFWNGGNERDEDFVLDERMNARGLELKRVFDNAVGEDFCRRAYSREYVLLRKVYKILIWGFSRLNGTSMLQAEKIMRDLENLHPDLNSHVV